jgi:hypothetical protein
LPGRTRRSIGDYTALAAWNGRVYGAWTAVTAPLTPAEEPKDESEALQRYQQVVRVGVADFTQR